MKTFYYIYHFNELLPLSCSFDVVAIASDVVSFQFHANDSFDHMYKNVMSDGPMIPTKMRYKFY